MTTSNDKIPLMDLRAQTQPLKREILAKLETAIDNCAFCLGPEVEAFEKEFSAFSGASHGVAMNSGTSALHLALLALGVGPGDEVITTPYTFVASAWAISYCGATPVFADIDPETFLIDPKAVARAITPKTKAILPVHLYGQPADLGPLLDVAKAKGIPLVEDAAQAHGALYNGKPAGSFGAISAFSFYPSKNLGACGEGGIALTSDAALAARMRALREHGSVKRYYHDEIGFNYRMEGFQAAVLRVKLPHLKAWNARRQEIAQKYRSLLEGTRIALPRVGPDRTHVYHLFVIRHPQRDKLADLLAERGIATGKHYPLALHMQKAYAHLKLGEGTFSNAEKAARECLSLPLFPELSDEQVERVAPTVAEASRMLE